MFPAIGGHGLGMCDFLDDYGIDPLKRASQTLGIDLESVGKHGPKKRFDLMHNAKSIIYAQSVAIAEMLKGNKSLDGSINIPSHSFLVTHMGKICIPYLETLLLVAKKPEIKFISSVTGEYIRDIKRI